MTKLQKEILTILEQDAQLLRSKLPPISNLGYISPRSLSVIQNFTGKMSEEISKLDGTKLDKIKAVKGIVDALVAEQAKPLNVTVADVKSTVCRAMLGDAKYESLAHRLNIDIVRTRTQIAAVENVTLDRVVDLKQALSGTLGQVIFFREGGTAPTPIKSLFALNENTGNAFNALNVELSTIGTLVEQEKTRLKQGEELAKMLFKFMPENRENVLPAIPPALAFAGKAAVWLGIAWGATEVGTGAYKKIELTKIEVDQAEESRVKAFCAEVDQAISTIYQNASRALTTAMTPEFIGTLNPHAYLVMLLRMKGDDKLRITSFNDKYTYKDACVTAQIQKLAPLDILPATKNEIDSLDFNDAHEMLGAIAKGLGVQATTFAKFAEDQRKLEQKLREESGLKARQDREQLFTNVLTYTAYSAVGLGVIWGLNKIFNPAKDADT